MNKKTFGELKEGDIIYKIHVEFDKDNYYIQEKIISEIEKIDYPGNFNKGDLLVKFKDNCTPDNIWDWKSYAHLISSKTSISWEEIHSYFISSNKELPSEILFYSTTFEEAIDIFKSHILIYLNKLNSEKESIDNQINNFKHLFNKINYNISDEKLIRKIDNEKNC